MLKLFNFVFLLFTITFEQANAYAPSSDTNYANKTYSIQVYNVSVAATATDVLTITGSANKVIRINRIQITADATAASIIDLYVYKRFSADTGGTSTALIPVQHDSTYPKQPTVKNTGFVVGQTYVVSAASTDCNSIGAANNTIGTNFVATGTTAAACTTLQSAVASVKLYSANPSALGYGLVIRADHYALPAAAASTGYPMQPWIEDFGLRGDQQIVLRGANESVSFSLNGQTIPSGFNAYVLISWVEE